MATRQQRIDAFQTEGTPPSGQPLTLLCEDHRGTYTLPYLCHWADGLWWNIATGDAIAARVLGWRAPTGLRETEE